MTGAIIEDPASQPGADGLSHLYDRSGWGGHPRGLTTLFFTEMWERFSYYGMRALLLLYMVAATGDGGLGMPVQQAAMIYGTYTMSVYLTSIPGGLLADRYLGARLAVLIGGIIIAAGHFCLAFPSVFSFYAGLVLIVVGTGFLKPNISTMLGSLYAPGDQRRDSGFSIFYMGINLGAALSPLVCGFLAQSREFKSLLAGMNMPAHLSWHWGFAAAGVGMVLGLLQYLAQQGRLAHVGSRPQRAKTTAMAAAEPLTADDWQRLGALAILFFFTMLFWSIYEQSGSSLNLFADRLTDNSVGGWHFPSSWYQSLSAGFVILLAPCFSILWEKLGKRQPSSPAKFCWGLILLGLGIALMVPASYLAAAGKVSPLWLVCVYLLQVAGELCLSPVGLSTVTKLAPARFLGLCMGVWFVAAALGNMLAGYLATYFDYQDPGRMVALFGSMAAAVFLAAGILAGLTPRVRRLMRGVH